jgi:hypothetical protein
MSILALFSGLISVLFGIVAVANHGSGTSGEAVVHNLPIEFVVLCFLATLVLVLWVFDHEKQPKKSRKASERNYWGLFIPAFAIAIIAGCWYSVYVPIYQPFRATWGREYVLRLGKPLSKWEFATNKAHQSEFTNGKHVWLNDGYFYVMHYAGQGYRRLVDNPPPPSQGNLWHDPKWVSRQLHLPSGCNAPEGSLAYAWSNDNYIAALGCEKWKCNGITQVAFQEFTYGRMIGIFRQQIEPSDDNGEIFILFDKGKEAGHWEQSTVHYKAPACTDD